MLTKRAEDSRVSHKIDHIQHLEEQLSLAYIALFTAQENNALPDKINRLEQDYRLAKTHFKNAKKNLYDSTNRESSAHIQLRLQQSDHPMKPQQQYTLPLTIFSEDEKEIITKHYATLPPELKILLDEALEDTSIALDKMCNPVFLRREGQLYDLSTVTDMLHNKMEANYPLNPSQKFKKEDIIPCNTLIRAMQIVLNIIHGQGASAPPVDANIQLGSQSARKRIPAELITLIEGYYQVSLLPKHRVLFDAICRDPITNIIMDDPVYLPDGYAYDRSTASLLLESAKLYGEDQAECPRNENILFKEEDVTNCFLVIKVLEQLKIIIQEKQSQIEKNRSDDNDNTQIKVGRLNV